jgi:hypothetical protein
MGLVAMYYVTSDMAMLSSVLRTHYSEYYNPSCWQKTSEMTLKVLLKFNGHHNSQHNNDLPLY